VKRAVRRVDVHHDIGRRLAVAWICLLLIAGFAAPILLAVNGHR